MKTSRITTAVRSGADTLSADTAELLRSAARWSRYLSIVGFVLLALIIIGLVAGIVVYNVNRFTEFLRHIPDFHNFFSYRYTVFYILFLLIYFIPTMYLYQFSVRVKRALVSNDGPTLREAVRALRKHYAFIGILVTLSLLVFKIGAAVYLAVNV